MSKQLKQLWSELASAIDKLEIDLANEKADHGSTKEALRLCRTQRDDLRAKLDRAIQENDKLERFIAEQREEHSRELDQLAKRSRPPTTIAELKRAAKMVVDLIDDALAEPSLFDD